MTTGYLESVDTAREFSLGGGLYLSAQGWLLAAFSHWPHEVGAGRQAWS